MCCNTGSMLRQRCTTWERRSQGFGHGSFLGMGCGIFTFWESLTHAHCDQTWVSSSCCCQEPTWSCVSKRACDPGFTTVPKTNLSFHRLERHASDTTNLLMVLNLRSEQSVAATPLPRSSSSTTSSPFLLLSNDSAPLIKLLHSNTNMLCRGGAGPGSDSVIHLLTAHTRAHVLHPLPSQAVSAGVVAVMTKPGSGLTAQPALPGLPGEII